MFFTMQVLNCYAVEFSQKFFYKNSLFKACIKAEITISKITYFNYLGLTEISGFYDSINDTIIAKNYAFQSFAIQDVIANWQKPTAIELASLNKKITFNAIVSLIWKQFTVILLFIEAH